MPDLLISAEQRRVRLARRHGLATPAAGVVHAADDLICLHATDPATIFLSVHARVPDATIEQIEDALFEERSLMRTLAMRRTLFVASRDVLPVIERSSSIAVAQVERKTLLKYLAQSSVDRPEDWLDAAFGEVLEALDGHGGIAAREITKRVPRLSTRITLGSGKYTQEAGATSRVLGLMAVEGLLARGRPAGLWTGRQYVWHRRDQWLPLSEPLLEEAGASVELIRRWLSRLRARDDGRPSVVDRLDEDQGDLGACRTRGRRGGARR